MEWGAAIAAVFGVLLWMLKEWQAGNPERQKEKRDDEIQQGRTDIATGNAPAVSDRIDRLLASGPGDIAGQSSGPVTVERIRAMAGMADSGRSTGPDTGTSGKVPEGG